MKAPGVPRLIPSSGCGGQHVGRVELFVLHGHKACARRPWVRHGDVHLFGLAFCRAWYGLTSGERPDPPANTGVAGSADLQLSRLTIIDALLALPRRDSRLTNM